MKRLITFIILLLSALKLSAQTDELKQTIIGTVTDQQSGNFLRGATVSLLGKSGNAEISSTTDSLGSFKLKNVPIGRQNIRVSLVGYITGYQQNIEVTSSKEVVLEIHLSENVKSLNEVVIRSDKRKDQPLNATAVVSARQLSIDEAVRYSGTRNDPSRMAQNFAGVSGSNDGRNDIVIRGNSPSGLLWRMDGIDIPNPNHFST